MKAETKGEATILAGIRGSEIIALGGEGSQTISAPDAVPSDETTVRAEFLRHYLVDGQLPDGARGTPRRGLRLSNAYVVGALNLTGTSVIGEPIIARCRFEEGVDLSAAKFVSLNLQGSVLPHLVAQRIVCEGNFKAASLQCAGRVSLAGAEVRGQVNFSAARLGPEPGEEQEGRQPLDLQNMDARGTVLLCSDGLDGATFVARDGVDFASATFRSGVVLTGGHFYGGSGGQAINGIDCTVRGDVMMTSLEPPPGWEPAEGRVRNRFQTVGRVSFRDAELRDVWTKGARFLSEELPDGRSNGFLDFEGARISGALRMDETELLAVPLDLRGARIGRLHDGERGWPGAGGLILDQTIYGTLSGSTDARELSARRDWLMRQIPGDLDAEFKPQPWEQCARVLREMGHVDDARDLMIEKERLQRRARRRAIRRTGGAMALPRSAIRSAADWLLGATTRYGRKPLLAVVWLAGLWIVGAGMFAVAYEARAMKPNNPFILRSPEWAHCTPPRDSAPPAVMIAPAGAGPPPRLARTGESQLDCFLRQDEAESYPAFNALVYSADTLLPIVQLEMQQFWIPDSGATAWAGTAARWFLWFQIVAGWALSLLAVAGFSGLIKQDSS